MFNPIEAKKILEKDRDAYISKSLKMIQGYLDSGHSDLAVESLITVANCLNRVTGTIQYLKQLTDFENDLPRFGFIFDD